MKLKNYILILVAIAAAQFAVAQQEAMYTHYMFNQLAINPAFAGTEDGMSFTALHRSQWVAFEGAPSSQSISGHMPIKGENFGVGFSINNDIIGPAQNLGLAGDFSYKLKIDEKATLGLGIKAALNFVSVGLNNLKTVNTSDVAFSQNISSGVLPNFGFGAYYYTKQYYAGLAIPKLLQNGFDVCDPTLGSIALNNEQRHYYLHGGAKFELNSDLEIEPSTLIKITPGAPMEIDITALFRYKERFWGGPMYRTGDALGVLIGMEVIDDLEVGYSFDWSFANPTFTHNGGSHEIMLKYNIPSSTNSSVKFN